MSEVIHIKASAVVNVLPVWAKLDTCIGLSGLPDNVIRRLYNTGKVRARKVDPEKRNSSCVYRVEDIMQWLDEDASSPAKFNLPGAE